LNCLAFPSSCDSFIDMDLYGTHVCQKSKLSLLLLLKKAQLQGKGLSYSQSISPLYMSFLTTMYQRKVYINYVVFVLLISFFFGRGRGR
jgi:hypothetical protein